MARRPLRKAFRRFSTSPFGEWILSALGAGYIRTVQGLVRWQVEGGENLERVMAGGPVIAAFWHGRLLLSPTFPPKGRRVVAIISKARDGDAITAIVNRFGLETARGSSYDHRKGQDKGGAAAFAAAERALRDGADVAMTPDGPLGPRMRAHQGAALLAIATGSPVLPVSFSTSSGRYLKSWDRFLLSWPWGRGVIVWGKPLSPKGASPEAFRDRIEKALTEVQNRADAMVGRTPVEPEDRA